MLDPSLEAYEIVCYGPRDKRDDDQVRNGGNRVAYHIGTHTVVSVQSFSLKDLITQIKFTYGQTLQLID